MEIENGESGDWQGCRVFPLASNGKDDYLISAELGLLPFGYPFFLKSTNALVEMRSLANRASLSASARWFSHSLSTAGDPFNSLSSCSLRRKLTNQRMTNSLD